MGNFRQKIQLLCSFLQEKSVATGSCCPVCLDNSLALVTVSLHVLYVCRLAYLKLPRISAIYHYLSIDGNKTLICDFAHSRMDYFYSLLAEIPSICWIDSKKKKKMLHVLSSNLQSMTSFSPRLRTGFLLPKEYCISFLQLSFYLCTDFLSPTE